MKAEILEIAQAGEPVLTQAAKPVTEFNDRLAQLAEQMMTTMIAAEGLGIAAPQVRHSVAMFIMASRPTSRYPDAPVTEPAVVINPKIVASGEAMLVDEEGCLSVANQRLPIARYAGIDVEYQDLQGHVIKQTLTGFPARVFQHEYDHLLGITVLERSQMPEQNSGTSATFDRTGQRS